MSESQREWRVGDRVCPAVWARQGLLVAGRIERVETIEAYTPPESEPQKLLYIVQYSLPIPGASCSKVIAQGFFGGDLLTLLEGAKCVNKCLEARLEATPWYHELQCAKEVISAYENDQKKER